MRKTKKTVLLRKRPKKRDFSTEADKEGIFLAYKALNEVLQDRRQKKTVVQIERQKGRYRSVKGEKRPYFKAKGEKGGTFRQKTKKKALEGKRRKRR